MFRKGHRRGVPPSGGAPPALPHPQPCLAFGRYWRGGVAIELRPILQPTSLRARWTPCRDEFRVVRDDRRLVIMGAGTSGEDKLCALGELARGHSGRSNPVEGQIKRPGTEDEVPRRTCCECAVEGTIEGQTRSGDTRGNLMRPDGGRTPECVCAQRGRRYELRNQRGEPGNLEETGAARPPPHEGGWVLGAGWDTYSD